jgi:hypothetical protein
MATMLKRPRENVCSTPFILSRYERNNLWRGVRLHLGNKIARHSKNNKSIVPFRIFTKLHMHKLNFAEARLSVPSCMLRIKAEVEYGEVDLLHTYRLLVDRSRNAPCLNSVLFQTSSVHSFPSLLQYWFNASMNCFSTSYLRLPM